MMMAVLGMLLIEVERVYLSWIIHHRHRLMLIYSFFD